MVGYLLARVLAVVSNYIESSVWSVVERHNLAHRHASGDEVAFENPHSSGTEARFPPLPFGPTIKVRQ